MKIAITIAISLLITYACAGGTNSNDPNANLSDPNAGPFIFTSPNGEEHTYYTWKRFPVVIQPLDGSEEEAEAVQDFNDVFGTEIFVLSDTDYDVSTFLYDKKSDESHSGNTHIEFKNNYISSAKIKISADITVFLYGLLQHELGHSLGFSGWHSSGSKSELMYPKIGDSGADFICDDDEFVQWMFEAYGLEADC